jgi:hypothetical protein
MNMHAQLLLLCDAGAEIKGLPFYQAYGSSSTALACY